MYGKNTHKARIFYITERDTMGAIWKTRQPCGRRGPLPLGYDLFFGLLVGLRLLAVPHKGE
jgi:hypothetical protein